MTKRRAGFLALFIIFIAALYFLSQFVWNRHLATVQAEEERIAQEQAIAAQQAAQEELRNRLINGDVGPENLKIVFLTFDDGPDEYTNQVLDILKNNDVKATFFTYGKDQEDYYDLYRRIVNDGHVLGNQTYSHDYTNDEDVDSFLEDVNQLTDFQRELTGVEPLKVFRFPGGSTNASQEFIDALVDQGYGYFDWNVEIDENTDITQEEVFENIIDGVHENSVSVVLLHSERADKESERNALDAIIKQLKSEGYTFMTLDPAYNISRFPQPEEDELLTTEDSELE